MLGRAFSISKLLIWPFALFAVACQPARQGNLISFCAPIGAEGFPRPQITFDLKNKRVHAFDASSPLVNCRHVDAACFDGQIPIVLPGRIAKFQYQSEAGDQLDVDIFGIDEDLKTVRIVKNINNVESEYIYNFKKDNSAYSLQVLLNDQFGKHAAYYEAC